jgi:acetyl-CoA acetyltransferase
VPLAAAITGIGMSKIGRQTMRAPIEHLADAALEAMATAGLEREEIDGITSFPGKSSKSPGVSPLSVADLRNALGLRTRWHSSSDEGPAQMSALMIAAMAVSTGQARHVLCFRALTESSSQSPLQRASVYTTDRVGDWPSWLLPMNSMTAVNWTAQFACRYFHEFGMTREHLGKHVVAQRANAQLNDRAIFNGKPLSLEDYLSARIISSPLSLYDCDIPIDGACAFIISAPEAAKDLRMPTLRIAAMGSAFNGKETWDQQPDFTRMASHDAAADMWSRTDMKPSDIDVLALYDGFSIFVPLWLEAFGFCGHGEAKDFILDGHTLLKGRYPVNTDGGQLSVGRLHGFGLLYEVCVQLWGGGGARQVPNARAAVCGIGGGPLAGALLIVRD